MDLHLPLSDPLAREKMREQALAHTGSMDIRLLRFASLNKLPGF